MKTVECVREGHHQQQVEGMRICVLLSYLDLINSSADYE